MITNKIWRFATILLLSLTAIPVCAQLDLPIIQREEKKGFVCTLDEMMPSFPGGDRALMEFLRNNIRCPEEVKKARLHGKVMVSFIVEKDGSVENVRAVSSYLKNKRGVRSRNWDLEKLCREEALRVFKLMPKWIPCSERLPDWDEHRDEMVLVCYGNGSIRFDTYIHDDWVHGYPIAWMPLPEPWRGEE